jgi:hypothetical protein
MNQQLFWRKELKKISLQANPRFDHTNKFAQ